VGSQADLPSRDTQSPLFQHGSRTRTPSGDATWARILLGGQRGDGDLSGSRKRGELSGFLPKHDLAGEAAVWPR
jgi:hypothetical protein